MRTPTRSGLAVAVSCVVLGLLTVAAAGADVPRTDVHGDPLPDGALARLGTVRWRAGSTIALTAFLPDGKSVLTLSQDFVAQVWDRDTGKELRHFDAAGPASANLNAHRYVLVNVFNNGAAVSADGKTLACASRDGAVRVWDVATGKEIGKVGEAPLGGRTQLALTADGKTLAMVTYGQKITVWNVADGKAVRSFGNATADITRLMPYKAAFSPDGKTLVQIALDFANAGGVKTSAIVFDAVGGKELQRITEPAAAGMLGAVMSAISPDAKLLALPEANKVKLIDLTTGKEKQQLEGHDGRATLTFAPDGKRLVALAGHNEGLIVWDVATGKALRQFGKTEVPAAGAAINARVTNGCAVSPDGKLLAFADGPALRLVDLGTGKGTNDSGHAAALRDVLFTRDGKTVLTSGDDGTVRRWDGASGKDLGQLGLTGGLDLFPIPSPDGRVIAAGAADASVRLIDAATGKEKHALRSALPLYGKAVVFSPDSRLLAVSSTASQAVELYDVATGKGKHVLPLPARQMATAGGGLVVGQRQRRVFFSPDSRLVAATDGNAIIWDAASGREERQIGLPAGVVRDALFSPDGRTVAVEMNGGEVGVWEVASGQKRLTIRTNAPGISTQPYASGGLISSGVAGAAVLAFSPDGRLLAQADDRTARLWDLRTGKEVGQFEGHRGPVLSLAFAPDGKRLATASSDTTALLWDAGPVIKKLPALGAVLPREKLDALWADLGQTDGARAYGAVRALAGDPVKAVPFLAERVKPAVAPDAARVARLIANLDNEEFSMRESARKELEKLGELALPAMRAALKAKPSPEQQRVLEELVRGATTVSPSGERMRLLRALEALELAGTPEAVKVLKDLAGGAPDALPTTQAKAVLERQRQR